MTKINFYKKENNYYKLEAFGHTNYDISGKDILCASISAITQTGALGILQVAKVNAKFESNENEGYILIELPQKMSDEQIQKCNIIFETMFIGLKDIESGFKKHIKLEVIK